MRTALGHHPRFFCLLIQVSTETNLPNLQSVSFHILPLCKYFVNQFCGIFVRRFRNFYDCRRWRAEPAAYVPAIHPGGLRAVSVTPLNPRRHVRSRVARLRRLCFTMKVVRVFSLSRFQPTGHIIIEFRKFVYQQDTSGLFSATNTRLFRTKC
jgi:hypothetical protein